MRISQVNNQQTNFKSGIVAEKGSIEIISSMIPEFSALLRNSRDSVQVKPDFEGVDMFWFSEAQSKLADRVRSILNLPPSYEKGFFADSLLQPNTMDTLVELSSHLREAES